jgi:hypothetical protein
MARSLSRREILSGLAVGAIASQSGIIQAEIVHRKHFGCCMPLQSRPAETHLELGGTFTASGTAKSGLKSFYIFVKEAPTKLGVGAFELNNDTGLAVCTFGKSYYHLDLEEPAYGNILGSYWGWRYKSPGADPKKDVYFFFSDKEFDLMFTYKGDKPNGGIFNPYQFCRRFDQ